MRKAAVLINDQLSGFLEETAEGFKFMYTQEYLNSPDSTAVSLTLPLSKDQYNSPVIFPFFDGLIPEGWLLDIASKNWKIDPRDRMGLLLSCCRDCLGNVSIHEIMEVE